MKCFFLLSFLFLSVLTTNAQQFSDYRIGEKLVGDDMINLDIGGVDGTLFIYTNKKK